MSKGFLINEQDITIEYSSRHYAIFYKGHFIGGAEVDKSVAKRRTKGNVALNKSTAELVKKQILNGLIPKYMYTAIQKVVNEEE